jgi:lipopolysaccharide transport system permease protein
VAQGGLISGITIAVALIAQDPVRDYLPRIAVSLMIWTFISNVLLESIELFTVERGLLLNTRIKELSLVIRVVWRQVLLSLYTLPVVVICVLAGGNAPSPRLLLLPLTLLVTGTSLVLPSLVIACLTLVRRDFAQVIPSVVQLLFFISPVMWQTPSTGRLNLLSDINPIAWTLEAIRSLVLLDTAQSSVQIRWIVLTGALVLCTLLISPITRIVRLRV